MERLEIRTRSMVADQKLFFLQHFADGLFRFVDLESKGNGRRLAIWMDRHHEFIRLLH
jgi:hypothetical protein